MPNSFLERFQNEQMKRMMNAHRSDDSLDDDENLRDDSFHTVSPHQSIEGDDASDAALDAELEADDPGSMNNHDSGVAGQQPAQDQGQQPAQAPAAGDEFEDLAADPELEAMFAKAGGLGEDPRNRDDADEGGEAARRPQFNNFWGASHGVDRQTGKRTKFGFGRRAANLLWRPLAIAGRLAAQPFRAAYRGLRRKPLSMQGRLQHERRNDAFEYRWGQFNRFFGINTDRRRQVARAHTGEDPGRFSRWGKG